MPWNTLTCDTPPTSPLDSFWAHQPMPPTHLTLNLKPHSSTQSTTDGPDFLFYNLGSAPLLDVASDPFFTCPALTVPSGLRPITDLPGSPGPAWAPSSRGTYHPERWWTYIACFPQASVSSSSVGSMPLSPLFPQCLACAIPSTNVCWMNEWLSLCYLTE